ncbi:MAG: acetate--CoA ligase family protein, partial [Nitrospira sp.]|nr:acetate--CoA ligase family protein [Nitrospira sp.]
GGFFLSRRSMEPYFLFDKAPCSDYKNTMRLLECESKKIFQYHGIRVPQGKVVTSAEEIPDEKALVLKAQIPLGGRGKAGGILFASNLTEAKALVKTLLGNSVRGYPIEQLLVEEKLPLEQEYYLGVTIDTTAKTPVVLFSLEGGVDIEELAETRRERIFTRAFKLTKGFWEHQAREIVAQAGIKGKELLQVSEILFRLVGIFIKYDAVVAEINPLAKTSQGEVLALDGHLEIEDDALYRHPELEKVFGIPRREVGTRQPSEFELKAAKIDSLDHRGVAGRMIEFDGELGLIIGGGGASLTAFDAIRNHGGKPANYCEIGGNPSVRKVSELTRLILSKKGVQQIAVIMNVVSNTRVDLVARGVIKGIVESGRVPAETISIFRVPGSWEREGFKILEKYNVPYCDRTTSIDEAARRAVTSVKKGKRQKAKMIDLLEQIVKRRTAREL